MGTLAGSTDHDCDLVRSKHWRERVKAARAAADELTDPDSKRRMLRIAADYEELARRAEKRLAAKNPK
jgi:molecular chaperone GrpE (heat shock protein)